MLGVSLRTVQLWVESEILSAWKTAGGHRRITIQSVEDLLERQQEALRPKNTAQEITVLVVEDIAYLRRLYRNMIDSWSLPIRLVTATNGFEGLYQLGNCKPDVLITDLSMPGMDGFRMVSVLCEENSIPESDIIVVTGLSEEEVKTGGELPDQIQLFYKPVPFDKIKLILEKKLAQLLIPVAS